ncbi:MAG: penicillin acylase family protein [Alphaproteobacteria bacterium]
MRLICGTISGLAILLAVPVGIAVLAVVVVLVIFATAQTDTSGEITLTGLDGPVSVIRDAHAVPHIFADTPLDAYRALGFVHAQDRFFQMEFMRRTAAGRLAEVIGTPGLRTDRFMRTLGIYRLAEASVEQLSPEATAVIEAYAEGVNGWMNAPGTKRPPEMIVLGLPFESWRAADSAAWVRLMSLLLSGDFRTELLRADLHHVLSPDQINDLWPDQPDDAPTTLSRAAEPLNGYASVAGAIPNLFPAASASNEWVVSGNRSASGKPLLANDPHLGFGAPGMWHLARIVTPDFTASGGALPGQPFFMIGRNNDLSWGLTTTHADTQDLFIERIDPQDPGRYLTPDGSRPFILRGETIRVRGRGTPERLVVRTTRHGPVLSDISDDAARAAAPGTVIALAFAALGEDDRTAEAVHGINTAKTVDAFRAALRDFHAPMQNVVYAHRDGSFGVVAAGRLPIRPGGPGMRPFPGWTGAHDWAGFVPFDALPQRQNPPDGVIINANNRVAPRSYPHTISNDWPDGFRARRIESLIAEREHHSLESFAAIQNDVLSLGARDLTTAMLNALPTGIRSQDIPVMMAAWDGSMDADRAEPLIYATWSHALRHHLMDDELGPFAGRYRGVRPRVMARMLTENLTWCDNRRTNATETCGQIVGAALDDALAQLRKNHGKNTAAWRWGDAHEAIFPHPLLRFAGPLARLISPAIETGGGDHTINRGTYRDVRNARYPHIHGPGLRAMFDMAAPDSGRFMIAPGQSGQVTSPHYGDLADEWRDGNYIVLNGTPDEIRRTATSELTLTP